MTRRALRMLWAMLLVAVVGLPQPAHAHGVLRRSAPASGERLTVAPRELRLTFNERIELAVARIDLLGPDSTTVALAPLRLGDSATVLVADIAGTLEPGTYTVAWQVAGRDGHPVRGRYRFVIAPGVAPAPDTAAIATPVLAPAAAPDSAAVPAVGAFDAGSPLYAAARWLGFASMLALAGAVGFALVVAPAALGRGAAEPAMAQAVAAVRTLGVVAAGVLLLDMLLRLAAQSVAVLGADHALDAAAVGRMLRDTTWGTGWLLQTVAAVAALAGLALARRRGGTGWRIAAGAVALAAVGGALAGHAAVVPGVTALAVAFDALHVVGAGGWLGTLLALVLVGLPAALREPAASLGPTAAALVHAYSPLALACAATVAVTGAAAAWWHVGSLAALLASSYGRTLAIKLAALALVAGTGAYNWRRVRPAMGDERAARRVRRSSTAELLIGAVVLAVTAVLVALPTPTDAVR